MTPAEFDEVCLLVCPHCRAASLLTKRRDTGEFVHNTATLIGQTKMGASISSTICWANGLRNSRFAPPQRD